MLPAFGTALALAAIPSWLLGDDGGVSDVKFALSSLGLLLLALSTFGREIGLQTMPLMLSQPLERQQVWRSKISVFAAFAVIAFSAAGYCGGFNQSRRLDLGDLLTAIAVVLVLTSGALWITLLVRQVLAAFWLSFLAPIAVVSVGALLGVPDWLIFILFLIYSIAGFIFARRQFLALQDTAWTGGVITFGFNRAEATAARTTRDFRPWAALIWKEIQLQQLTLAGMACLLVLHIGAVAERKTGGESLGKTVRWALEIFGLLWLFAPLVVGSQSVAEERKIGTMAANLCLPIPRFRQWSVKLFIGFIIGDLLSATLFWAVQRWVGGPSFAECLVLFAVILIFGFYGSTLTNGVLQALGGAALTIIGVWIAFDLTSTARFNPYLPFSSGILLVIGGVPIVLVVLLVLSYFNFGKASESMQLWRRNALAVAATVGLCMCVATAIYHRVWESILPEAPHGPPRIALNNAPVFSGDFINLTAVFPDGRLWMDRAATGSSHTLGAAIWSKRLFAPGIEEQQEDYIHWEGKFESLGGLGFVPGTNWTTIACSGAEAAAIRSDGSLWVSEYPAEVLGPLDYPLIGKAAPLVRFGEETNWQTVVAWHARSMLLLKGDGSLWAWGTNLVGPVEGLRHYQPRRLGTDSDWARLEWGGYQRSFLWKTNGSAWSIISLWAEEGTAGDRFKNLGTVLEPAVVITNTLRVTVWKGKQTPVQSRVTKYGTALERVPHLDNVRWRSACYLGMEMACVGENGTLWFWNAQQDREWRALKADEKSGRTSPHARVAPPEGAVPLKIGKETNWAQVVISGDSILARKTDGSLWKWDVLWHFVGFYGRKYDLLRTLQSPPVRMDTNNDWVGLTDMMDRPVSLAADGGVWVWPPQRDSQQDWSPFMAASKKPRLIENIFASGN